MTSGQKAIKYVAIAFAIFLIVNITFGVISLVASGLYIFSDEDEKGEKGRNYTEYTVEGEIDTLDIDISSAVIEINSGETFLVKSNCSKLSVNELDGKLVVEEKSKKGLFRKDKDKVIVTIPEEYEFDEVYFNAGAGKVSVNELFAKVMDMSFGAGEVKLSALMATKEAKIEGGVGEVDIDGCILNDADIDMGVGEFNIRGKLTGNSNINYGVGEANLKLEGTKDDYSIDIDKGIGEVKVNDESINGDTTIGNGDNYISIDGGIGEIDVEYYLK